MSTLLTTERRIMVGPRVVGAIIMDVTYGIQVTGMDDSYIEIAEKVLQLAASAMLPGSFLVDMVPIRASHSISFLA